VIQFSAPPRSLALETGGFNISRPDQFAEGVTQIIRETGSYYLLGYEPPPRKNTGYNMIGGLRSLEIKVRRPGAVVKARRGYITAPEAKPPKNPPAASTAALSGVLPRTDLALRVHAAPFAVPGKGEALVAVTVGVTQPPVATRTLDRLDVQVRAFTANGDERARSRYQADAWLSRTQDDAASVDIVTELRLKPGTYALRVGSTSERLGTSGSVYADVVVPDFASAPLSLSGILVFSAPQLDHVLPEPLSALLPAIPTTRRDFTGRVLVRAYGRVYQGLRAPLESVEITTTILDGGNAIVLERTESIAPAGFATDRAADLRIDVPVAEFAAGLYRLRVVARAGQNTVTRDVVFRVR
jgi:hypothetical protein